MSNQELKHEAFFNIGETSQINFEDKINEKKEESQDNFDNLAFDKKLWNLGGDIQYPDLSLKKESESKLSIDIPDISKQRLKEYLNEDLLNEIDISPKTTPKNIIKDATFNNNFDFNNNNENNENNETINITNITDDKNIVTSGYGLYDDVFYVTYKTSDIKAKVIEDDKVTIYGTCTGTKTYTTVLGASKTLPALEAENIVFGKVQ